MASSRWATRDPSHSDPGVLKHMAKSEIAFNDGAAYERMIGKWSQIVGNVFLEWLAAPRGLRWIDVGCGSGAFTQLIVDQSAPIEVDGIDPAEAQLAFARMRPAARIAKFHQGSAMALPFDDASFDAAVMALVIFFVPDPAKGVAEMARVVRPGGLLAAYAWDVYGDGMPTAPIQVEMRELGVDLTLPPSVEASRLEVLRELWAATGLVDIETRVITVHRTFDDFEDFWTTTILSSSMASTLAPMTVSEIDGIKERVRTRMQPDETGRIACSARVNAIKGRVRG